MRSEVIFSPRGECLNFMILDKSGLYCLFSLSFADPGDLGDEGDLDFDYDLVSPLISFLSLKT